MGKREWGESGRGGVERVGERGRVETEGRDDRR